MSTFTRRDIILALTAGAVTAGAVTIARDPSVLDYLGHHARYLGRGGDLDRPRDFRWLRELIIPPNRELRTVDGVIDAETIEVSDGRGSVSRVRLIGIYAPLVGQQGEEPECGADEVTAFVADLLPAGTPVYLVHDSHAEDKDQHGRLLRYVETVDGTDVGHLVLSEGYGVNWNLSTDPAFDRFEDYNHAAVIALDHNRGSWASCSAEDFPPQKSGP
ncbi:MULTISPECIES: thermonuclease family protein [Brachybacterium]|uniref:thermonuclease family protein n=1 Tax=Brachybacterium TaxID=43668 RepID=UPI0006B4B1F5|nr:MULTISPECIES: thermonuclease family protein [Brachybacterium]